jgi:hypothetical protein
MIIVNLNYSSGVEEKLFVSTLYYIGGQSDQNHVSHLLPLLICRGNSITGHMLVTMLPSNDNDD